MPTTAKTALDALHAALLTIPNSVSANPGDTVASGKIPVYLEPDKDLPPLSQGAVAVFWGDQSEPVDTTLSPLLYHWVHRVEVDAMVSHATATTRRTNLDTLLSAISAAILADQTLGGAVEYAALDTGPQIVDEEITGAATERGAILTVTLHYTTAGSALA